MKVLNVLILKPVVKACSLHSCYVSLYNLSINPFLYPLDLSSFPCTHTGSVCVMTSPPPPCPLWLSWLSTNTNACSGGNIPHPGSYIPGMLPRLLIVSCKHQINMYQYLTVTLFCIATFHLRSQSISQPQKRGL